MFALLSELETRTNYFCRAFRFGFALQMSSDDGALNRTYDLEEVSLSVDSLNRLVFRVVCETSGFSF